MMQTYVHHTHLSVLNSHSRGRMNFLVLSSVSCRQWWMLMTLILGSQEGGRHYQFKAGPSPDSLCIHTVNAPSWEKRSGRSTLPPSPLGDIPAHYSLRGNRRPCGASTPPLHILLWPRPQWLSAHKFSARLTSSSTTRLRTQRSQDDHAMGPSKAGEPSPISHADGCHVNLLTTWT